MEKEQLTSTNELLRVIVALLLRRKNSELLTLKQQIEILDDLGMKPIKIAEIIGRSNVYVHKELSGLRKKRQKSGGK